MTTTTTEERDALREKLQAVNKCALNARLSGELAEAARLQRQVVQIHRWMQEVQRAS